MITKYKKILRKLKISHRVVAEYTGHRRETMTNWLNGVNHCPKFKEAHLEQEIKEIIADKEAKNDN
jgi:hypothetical protein